MPPPTTSSGRANAGPGQSWLACGSEAPSIKPTEARDVARHVIGELLRLRCRFDLRLLVGKALPDFQQWKDGETESHWRELVTASIEEHLAAAAPAVAGPRNPRNANGRGPKHSPNIFANARQPRRSCPGLDGADREIGAGVLSTEGGN